MQIETKVHHVKYKKIQKIQGTGQRQTETETDRERERGEYLTTKMHSKQTVSELDSSIITTSTTD